MRIRGRGMGRIAGAIFLFATLLAHVPIVLMRVGVHLLAATVKFKVYTTDLV